MPVHDSYLEPVAVGDLRPEMPVFLTADRYVPCPLEATYQTAHLTEGEKDGLQNDQP